MGGFMEKLNKDILVEVFGLKKKLRTGWMLPGRDIKADEVESVADHTWAACMIAELFLPETMEELVDLIGHEPGVEEYDKKEILRILIIHDLSEAYVGDIALGYKTDVDRQNEENRMAYYASLAKYAPFQNFAKIFQRWENYEERKSYNSKIVKDIDQLECYIQLYMYKNIIIDRNGKSHWEELARDWADRLKIRTNYGKWLYNFIYNSLFS